ncbi:MAG: hypothetical protein ACTS6G_03465 [Candidatus Hodgkinia cicadicola]
MRPKECKDEWIAFHQETKFVKGAVWFRCRSLRVNQLAKAAEGRNQRRVGTINSTLWVRWKWRDTSLRN